jgi:hypothetical protein
MSPAYSCNEGGARPATNSPNWHMTATSSSPAGSIVATMDIDALHSTLLSITVASEKLRSARKSLPMLGDARSGVGKSIYEVENDLRIAKGTLAAELGFSLCPRCWPPELVAADRKGRINCPVCGQVSCEEAA